MVLEGITSLGASGRAQSFSSGINDNRSRNCILGVPDRQLLLALQSLVSLLINHCHVRDHHSRCGSS